jgi:hypothetical protein
MPAPTDPFPRFPSADWTRLEPVLKDFEAALRRGERPAIEAFLLPEGADTLPLLIELVHLDLEYRLKAGEAAGAEDYCRRFPQLATEPTVLRALCAAEENLRRQPGRRPEWGA